MTNLRSLGTVLRMRALPLVLSVVLASIQAICNGQGLVSLELLDPTPNDGSCYGCSVALHGEYAFVAEPGNGYDHPGVVHVFQRNADGMNGWGHVQTIENPDPNSGSFGAAIAAAEDTLFIMRKTASTLILGVSTCISRTVFFYAVGVDGLWTFDQQIGGTYINPLLCDTGHPVCIEYSNGHVSVADGAQYVFFGQMGMPPEVRGGITLYSRSNEEWVERYSIGMVESWYNPNVALALTHDTLLWNGGLCNRDTLFYDSLAFQDTLCFDSSCVFGDMHGVSGLVAGTDPNDSDGGTTTGSVYIFDLRSPQAGALAEVYPESPSSFGAFVLLKDRYMAVSASLPGLDPYWALYEGNVDGTAWVLRQDLFATGSDVDISPFGEVLVGSTPPTLFFDPLTAVQPGLSNRQLGISLRLEGNSLSIQVTNDVEAVAELVITDILGRVTQRQKLSHDRTAHWDTGGWPKGIYICYLESRLVHPCVAKFIIQ